MSRMLPQSLHGEPIVAVLLRADEPLSQFLLRGELRWDGTTLWLEWYSGGFPLPVNLDRLDRALTRMTPEFRAEFARGRMTPQMENAIASASYFGMFWVTAATADAIPAHGIVGVAGHPRADQIIDVERWATRLRSPG